MKILVFDDSPIHQESARLSLAAHSLQVVSTYDEAEKALSPETNYTLFWENEKKLIQEARLPERVPGQELSLEAIRQREKISQRAREMATTYPDFDVVLTDLLVPASKNAQGETGRKFVGQEMPLGTTIAILALVVGIKKVAVVTDMSHHDHPASAAFDCLNHAGNCRIPGVSIICTNHVRMINIDQETGQIVDPDFLHSKEGEVKYPVDKANWSRKGIKDGGKDWSAILTRLLEENENPNRNQ